MRSGSIRITYSYPLNGALQAELSVRDDNLNKGFTIVGRPTYRGTAQTAYLPVHVPTRDTYLDTAFVNPTGRDVNIQVSIRGLAGWKGLAALILRPNSNGTVHVPPEILNDPDLLSSTRVAVVKAEYSVTTTEIVSNAWQMIRRVFPIRPCSTINIRKETLFSGHNSWQALFRAKCCRKAPRSIAGLYFSM